METVLLVNIPTITASVVLCIMIDNDDSNDNDMLCSKYDTNLIEIALLDLLKSLLAL